MKNKPTTLLALLLFGLTGCVILSTFAPEDKFAFGHRLHVDDEGLDCIDCHMDAEDMDEPGYPRIKQCNLCHQDIDEEQPEERRMEVLYEDGSYLLTHPDGFSEEVVFSHLAHVEVYEDDCTACHGEVAMNDQPGHLEPYRMADCVSCHEAEGRDDSCQDCHQQIDLDYAPRTHDLAWDRMHGEVYRGCSESTANDCTLCHTEQSCNDCHRTEQPDSHNVFFARKGHGLHAQIDRDSCSTCHTPDSCDRCHSTTEPLSHVGSFGGTVSNHCVGCHLPLQGESCFTCHKDTPSHSLATPLPMDHNPGMNCRQCHGLDQPLPHVDKGDACINCHM